MANTVRLKRSAVQGRTPTTSDLALGEIALNTYDGKLFIKKNDGTDSIVEIGAGGGEVSTSDTAPSNPNDGDLWYRSSDGRLYVYYDDGSTSQWVDANPNLPIGAIASDDAPSNPNDGDLWYRTSDGRMYVYYNDGNTSQWVDANPNTGVDSVTFERSGTTVSLVNSGDTVDLSGDLEISGTSHVAMPVGTTAQRPATPANGQQRYNSDLGAMEIYVQGQWQPIANTSIDYGLITTSSTTTFDYGALS
jgi:hypothetical protein